MHILVETIAGGGKRFKLAVQPDDTCAVVKARIQDQKGNIHIYFILNFFLNWKKSSKRVFVKT